MRIEQEVRRDARRKQLKEVRQERKNLLREARINKMNRFKEGGVIVHQRYKPNRRKLILITRFK